MYLLIQGRVSEDEWSTQFVVSVLGHAPANLALLDAFGVCGYTLIRASAFGGVEPSRHQDPPDLELGEIMEDCKNTMDDEYMEREVDTYSVYKAMSDLDIAIDLLDRMGPHDGPSEIAEARMEVRDLIASAIAYLEVVTNDTEEDHDQMGDDYWGEQDE